MRNLRPLACGLLLVGRTSLGAEDALPPPPPPPPPPEYAPPATLTCNPGCGPGEVCASNGQCVASASSQPGELDGQKPAPPGYHYETRRRTGMLIGGLVPLGVGYLVSNFYGFTCLTSTTNSGLYRGTGNLLYLIPVVGPIARQAAAFSNVASCPSCYGGFTALFDMFLTVVFTAAEVVGAVFTLVGLFRTTTELVPDGVASSSSGGSSLRWSVGPMLAPGGAGVSVGLRY